ncbi:THOC6 [Acanthosepion pharaonis]|uniref:THOC6 n=1 Tax=Acanthosepion pharaonis TaxID=158019 RepID=A0A812AS37_ACAPH|nr:THOC6 [Sepia pharaonis]
MPASGNNFLPQNMMQQQNLSLRQQLYTSVYTTVYSPCGKYLAAGNNYGYCAIFSLPGSLAFEATENSWKPIFTFKVSEDGPVYSMTTTNRELICGCSGYIKAWLWSNIIKRTNKLAWSLIIPTKSFSVSEINSMVTDDRDGNKNLFAGCGDNLIYIFDLENSSLKSTLSGHKDYIHCVTMCNTRSEFVSASEDGSVRIWDPRSKNEAIHIIEPYRNEMCARPEFGKWLGCVTMDTGDDWLVCGGGPQLSLWHMRSLSATITFETPNSCQKHALIHEDTVLSAGSEPYVFHWSLNGELKAQIPCTPTYVYKVDVNTTSESNKVLCIAGNSSKIDVCTNFNYKAFSLTFPPCS